MPDDADESQGGAPVWMMTYGDTITLLLTFFVMLLTFSTPNKEDFNQMAAGLLKGGRRIGLGKGAPGAELMPQERRLEESRLDQEGAEKPPQTAEGALADLQKYYEDVDVSELPDLSGALLIRMPVVELFGTGTELVANGRAALGHVVKMARARPYSIVVRVEAPEGVPPGERLERALELASRVAEHLHRQIGAACRDIGVSTNVQLAPSALPAGYCEIILLEV